ncbi:MAG: Gfo/Idh/MocA family protein [Flavobacteriales bacterium]
MNRSSFLKLTTSAAAFFGLGAATSHAAQLGENDLQTLLQPPAKAKGNMAGFKAEPLAKVRIGLIGLGNRGSTHCEVLKWMVQNERAEVVALCDKVERKTRNCLTSILHYQNNEPQIYFGSEDAWKKLCQQTDIDLIIISTPWEWHAQMCVYAMEQGKHVACEVPIACTIKECWQLIEVSERTQKHCIMLENCCFNDEELWLMNMVHEGVFGELTHAEGAYLHDLRGLLLDKKYYEDQWRLKHHIGKNENLYTTHGLGPIAFYMGIGRGDTFTHLSSMSSLEHNLTLAAKKKGETISGFTQGDMNTTLIKTMKGRSIMLQHDVHTGRPYSRINLLAGTRAVHDGYPSRLYVEPEEMKAWGHNWLNETEYNKMWDTYLPSVWTKLKEQIKDNEFAHGGMDFVMLYRLVACLNQGLPLDINLYDGVMWSAITPLSGLSVKNNSASIKVPDFTGGKWKQERPLEVLREV